MKKFLMMFSLIVVAACTSTPKLDPISPPTGQEPVSALGPTPAPTPTPTPSPVAKALLQDIQDMAAGSRCAVYTWKNGAAPVGYYKGIATVYAKAVCNQTREDVKIVARASTSNLEKDVLAHYGIKAEAGIQALRKTYAILIGLGPLESSGRACCGRDMKADYASASAAEAGMFQASWGSRTSELSSLYKDYQAGKYPCRLELFNEGAGACSAGDAKSWGEPSDPGYAWQKYIKSCPALAAEWAAVVMRVSGGSLGEFGPLRKKNAELRPECENLLLNVEKIVEVAPEICQAL